MPLEKQEFEQILDKTLTKALEDQAQTIIEAVDFGFKKAEEDRASMKEDITFIKHRLTSLEKRITCLEDIMTKHGKELKKIRKILTWLQKQREVDEEKVDLLEQRVAGLEALA